VDGLLSATGDDAQDSTADDNPPTTTEFVSSTTPSPVDMVGSGILPIISAEDALLSAAANFDPQQTGDMGQVALLSAAADPSIVLDTALASATAIPTDMASPSDVPESRRAFPVVPPVPSLPTPPSFSHCRRTWCRRWSCRCRPHPLR
jgi:hypothetical protein